MKGMKTACKRFYEESACSKQQDCAWHDHACLSQHAAQQTCEDLTGQSPTHDSIAPLFKLAPNIVIWDCFLTHSLTSE